MTSLPKLLFTIGTSTVIAVFALSFILSESYSLNNPLEFSEIMKSESGYSSITVSGESSATLEPDSAVMTLVMNDPPYTDLKEAMDQYNQKTKEISESLKQELEQYDDDVTISYMRTNFDGNRFRYGGGPDPTTDSYTAYMSFPIKVDMDKYQNITQKILDLGFRIDDIRISKVLVDNDNLDSEKDAKPSVEIIIPTGSSVPSCETTNECYIPAEITIDAGTEVVWHNDDTAAHTVTSGSSDNGPDGVFDSQLFMGGTTFSHVFSYPGEFPYFCLVHPWMVGTVIVSGDAPEDSEYKLEASINVRLETRPDTLENTLSSYTKKLDELSALLEENGMRGEIPRSSININPSYYPPSSFDSYNVHSRWSVKTTLENLDQVYETLSKYGGIERLYLTHSKSSIEDIRQELTQHALDDARKKALEIVEPMNLNVKGIKNIEINQAFDQERAPQMLYRGVLISYDDWNNVRDGNITVLVDVEFEVGRR